MARPPNKYRKLKCSFCKEVAVRTTDSRTRYCKGHYDYQKVNLSIKWTVDKTWAIIVQETPGYLAEFISKQAAIFRAYRFMEQYNSDGSILVYGKRGENLSDEIFFTGGKSGAVHDVKS